MESEGTPLLKGGADALKPLPKFGGGGDLKPLGKIGGLAPLGGELPSLGGEKKPLERESTPLLPSVSESTDVKENAKPPALPSLPTTAGADDPAPSTERRRGGR